MRVRQALWKDDDLLKMVVLSLWEITAYVHQLSDRKTSWSECLRLLKASPVS